MSISLTIKCNNCGHFTELTPENVGQESDLSNQLGHNFRVNEYEVDIDVEPSIDDDVIEKLSNESNYDNIEDVLQKFNEENVDIEERLDTLRIDCQKCENYIVLKEFD